MQSEQLAREGQLPVGQLGLALKHDEAAVLRGFDGFGLGFFHAIAFEAGTAVN
jgi:hypothetical protein